MNADWLLFATCGKNNIWYHFVAFPHKMDVNLRWHSVRYCLAPEDCHEVRYCQLVQYFCTDKRWIPVVLYGICQQRWISKTNIDHPEHIFREAGEFKLLLIDGGCHLWQNIKYLTGINTIYCLITLKASPKVYDLVRARFRRVSCLIYFGTVGLERKL